MAVQDAKHGLRQRWQATERRLVEKSAAGGRGWRVTRLLWALTVGGMVLSLSFGDLVTRLIEAVDAVLLQQQEEGL